MKDISVPTSIKDIKFLWKLHTNGRFTHNANVVRKLGASFIMSILDGRWREVSDKWSASDREQFREEMTAKVEKYIKELK